MKKLIGTFIKIRDQHALYLKNCTDAIKSKFEVKEKDFVNVTSTNVAFNFECQSQFKRIIFGNSLFLLIYSIYSSTAIISKDHPEYLKKPNKFFLIFNLGMVYLIYKCPSKVLSRIVLNKNLKKVKLEKLAIFKRSKDIIVPIESIVKIEKLSDSPVINLLYKIEIESSKKREFYIFHVNYNVIKNQEFLNFLDLIKK